MLHMPHDTVQDGRLGSHPLVRHADYPLIHFLALAASMTPEAVYALERRAPYICRLPPDFRYAHNTSESSYVGMYGTANTAIDLTLPMVLNHTPGHAL